MSYPDSATSSDNQNSRRNIVAAGAIGVAVGVAVAVASLTGDGQGQGGDSGKCFLKGTRIRTADGDRKIEDLAVGDFLPTVFGGICPIEWIGYYRLKKSNQAKPWGKDVRPVRVARSALGRGMPHAELYVTKEHALLIDGVLVTAGSLINGTTITLYDASEHNELEFFHIKLARHNVIYAEGTPCETVINFNESAANFAEYLNRYGPPVTDEVPCAPILSCTGARREIRSHLRSAVSPWIDCRQKLDIIRDGLRERGISLLRQSELS